MNYLDEQIKKCIDSLDRAIKEVNEVNALLISNKVLSDLDKHMALYEAEIIAREI